MRQTRESWTLLITGLSLLLSASCGIGDDAVQQTEAPPSEPAAQQAAASGDIPCDVAAVLSKHCAECHGASTQFGAPMSLAKAADFAAASKSGPPYAQVVPTRLTTSDTNRRMPPISKTAPSAAELSTLQTWLGGGAKAATSGCAVAFTPPTTTPSGDGSKGGSGLARTTPIDYDDPQMECYKLLTFSSGNKNQPYRVAAGASDQYVNFYFRAPWTGVRYTRAIKLIIDNKAVIHHWLLFNNRSPGRDGTVAPSSGIHGADEELLYGWGPGASPLYLDPDVGQRLESGTGFTMEAHYNNRGGSAADASGAELCVTPRQPKNVAGLSWVGSDAIAGVTATGQCRPRGNQTIRIIAAQPHMHTKGRAMRVVVNRRDGKRDVIHDKPFSFESQIYYPLDVTLEPGDSMTTTCSYSAPARFGQRTSDEMCYFFSLHYPAGALVGGTGGLIHGGYSCL